MVFVGCRGWTWEVKPWDGRPEAAVPFCPVPNDRQSSERGPEGGCFACLSSPRENGIDLFLKNWHVRSHERNEQRNFHRSIVSPNCLTT